MKSYRTLTGRSLDLQNLTPKERDILLSVWTEFQRKPDWEEFSFFWQKELRDILSKLSPDEQTQNVLYQVAQDLEMRLGIAQGQVAEPDYRDYLVDRIEEKFGTRYRFCKATGIPQPVLSQVLSGKKDFSIDNLYRAAKALGLSLALLPKEEIALGSVDAVASLKRAFKKAGQRRESTRTHRGQPEGLAGQTSDSKDEDPD